MTRAVRSAASTFGRSCRAFCRTAGCLTLVPDTLVFFGADARKLVLTHLNHTNPALVEGSAARALIAAGGAAIAREGQVFPL